MKSIEEQQAKAIDTTLEFMENFLSGSSSNKLMHNCIGTIGEENQRQEELEGLRTEASKAEQERDFKVARKLKKILVIATTLTDMESMVSRKTKKRKLDGLETEYGKQTRFEYNEKDDYDERSASTATDGESLSESEE